jgi:hypothetical protein
MTACKDCGREPENGVETHWLGCSNPGRNRRAVDAGFTAQPAPDPGLFCEHHGCPEAKREWSGKGAKPKYCQKHSDPKNRK